MFDEAGQRAGLQLAGSGLRFARDQVGRALATEFAGGRIDSAFDSMGRLAARSAVGGQSSPWQVNYGYGPGGELLAVHDSAHGQRRYSLDAAGRITSVEGDTATEHYTYDPAGNITNAEWYTPNTDAATQGQRSYQGSLLIQAGRDRYEYDTAGRLTGRSRALLSGGVKQWRFTWNSLNQLTATTTPDGHHWTYHYDALNRRTSKTHHDPTGHIVETYHFTWDGPTLIEQTHTTNNTTTTTTWEHEGLTPIAQTTTHSEPSQAQIDAEFAAIITDLVGTPIRLLNTNGKTTWTNHANTWGATTANHTMPLRFAGQYHDTETGLHYNYNRYYNPDTGRYITTDPLGLTPSPNPHTYVTNPTTTIDPLGLSEMHGLHSGPLLTRQEDEFGNRITNPPKAPNWQVKELAEFLGYRRTGQKVDGQFVYRNGHSHIVHDQTAHSGGFWKVAGSVADLGSKSTRAGTYDFLLQYIGK